MQSSRLRPVFRLTVIAVALAAAMLPGARQRRAHEAELASQRAGERMLSIARSLPAPPGASPMPASACPGAGLARCWHVDAELDATARLMRARLGAAVSAAVALTCRDVALPAAVTYRSCVTRFDRYPHGVLVSVDSDIRVERGRPRVAGSIIRVFSA